MRHILCPVGVCVCVFALPAQWGHMYTYFHTNKKDLKT